MATAEGVALEELLYRGARVEENPVAVRRQAFGVVGGFDGAPHFEGRLEAWSRGGEVGKGTACFHLCVYIY